MGNYYKHSNYYIQYDKSWVGVPFMGYAYAVLSGLDEEHLQHWYLPCLGLSVMVPRLPAHPEKCRFLLPTFLTGLDYKGG